MKNRFKIAAVFISIFIQFALWAGRTKYITLKGVNEFMQGTRKNVAVDKLGRLSLSPETKELFNNQDLLVYAIKKVENKLYIGTGNKDILYELNLETGKWKILFQGKGLAINSLAVAKDRLFFSESPSNQVYSLDFKTGKIEKLAVFEQETYIWKLLYHQDKLYVATGDGAKIYEMDGKGNRKELFANSQENHFLALTAFRDKLYFSSEGLSVLYELDLSTGKTRSLYDTYEDEINDIYVNSSGEIYFVTSSQTPKKPGTDFDYTDSFEIQNLQKKAAAQKEKEEKKQVIKNSLYAYRNGKIDKLFTRDNTVFYSVTKGQDGNLYVGGAGGLLYRYLKKDHELSIFMTLKEEQVLQIIAEKDGLYASTGNLGKVYFFSYSYASQGEYLSRVLDLGGESRPGRVSWEGTFPKNTEVKVFIRSGGSESVDESWSSWTGPYINSKGSVVSIPSARYLQYRIKLITRNSMATPVLESLIQPYLLENRAPSVSFFRAEYGSKDKKDPPFILNLRWNAYDSDEDRLVFQLFFREKGETEWLPLTEKIYDNQFKLDTRILPDGDYQIKLTVSDELTNTPEDQKITEEISSIVTIDNTSPVVRATKAKKMGDFIRIEGVIEDSTSLITRAYYSLNAENWEYFLPSDGIFDAKEEKFLISIPEKALDKNRRFNIIFIRFFDAQDNQITVKVKINQKGHIVAKTKDVFRN